MSQGIEPLPLPDLENRICSGIPVLTDQTLFDRLGLRVAFTSRAGGVSEGAYASLNLSDRVGDDAAAVAHNRTRLCEAFGADPDKLVVPTQVHGVKIVSCGPECAGARVCTNLTEAQQEAEAGADAVLVSVPDVPALLCFADCVPLILAAPSGSFAVVHAGWRGVLAGIAGDAVRALLDAEVQTEARVQAQARMDTDCEAGIACEADTSCEASMLNAYIGPYIHAECFECDAEVVSQFAAAYGRACVVDESHVDLGAALRCDLARAGVISERIADADLCTVCNNERYFSYRAQDGCAGRHGAFAIWQGGRA